MPIYAGNKKISFNQSVLAPAFAAAPTVEAIWGNISGNIKDQRDLTDLISSEIEKAADYGPLSAELSSMKKRQDSFQTTQNQFQTTQNGFQTKLNELVISNDWCVNRINTVETEIPLSTSQLINDVGYLSSIELDPAQISTLVKLDGYSKVDHTHDISDLNDKSNILNSMISVNMAGATKPFKTIVLEDTQVPGSYYGISIQNGSLKIQPL